MTTEHNMPGSDEAAATSGEQRSSRSAAESRMADRVQSLRLDKDRFGPAAGGGRKKFWVMGALLLVAGAGAWSWYNKHFGPYALAEVEAVTATMSHDVKIVLDAAGYVVAHETVEVSPSIPGKVIELHFEEGEKVETGEILARLEDDQHKADLRQAEATLESMRARLKELKRGALEEDIEQVRASLDQAKARRDSLMKNYQRAKQLKATISPMEFDTIEGNYREAEAHVAQLENELKSILRGTRPEHIEAASADVKKAEAAVERAKYFVENAVVRAPISGTVLERTVDVGERAVPDSIRAGICVLADLRNLEAEIDIPEQELAGIQLGQPCLITTEAYSQLEYHGRVEWFSPVFDRQRGVRRAKIKILDPDDHLRPGMTCRAQILEKGAPVDLSEKLRIPVEAVVRQESGAQGAGTYVFVLEEMQCRRRPVVIGEEVDHQVEVREGLKSGEIVLLPGDHQLTDGQTVHPKPVGKSDAE